MRIKQGVGLQLWFRSGVEDAVHSLGDIREGRKGQLLKLYLPLDTAFICCSASLYFFGCMNYSSVSIRYLDLRRGARKKFVITQSILPGIAVIRDC